MKTLSELTPGQKFFLGGWVFFLESHEENGRYSKAYDLNKDGTPGTMYTLPYFISVDVIEDVPQKLNDRTFSEMFPPLPGKRELED